MHQNTDRTFIDALIKKAASEGIRRYSVGAAIWNAAGELLVLKRKADDSFPGMYEIPGGGVDDGETLYDAVCRETREETGLLVKNIDSYCGMFDYDEKGRTRQFNFIVTVQDTKSIVLSEHDDFLWIASAADLCCTAEMKRVIETIFENAIGQKEKRN